MKLNKMCLSLLACGVFYSAPSMSAFTLTFEGVGNFASVNDFYNGGTDSQGNSGTNYGINFNGPTLGLIDEDAGGSGNFANEPSPNTIMFFTDADHAIMNMSAGFSTGFSFWYTSSTNATVNVYDGLNGTGTLLASLNLNAQYADSCGGDPSGDFCNWTAVGVGFSGVAHSIDFGGTASLTGYDNITFGSDTPTPPVPEPETYAMLLIGLGLLGFAARHRKQNI